MITSVEINRAQEAMRPHTERYNDFLKLIYLAVADPKKTGWVRMTAHHAGGKVTRVQIAMDNNADGVDSRSGGS